MAQTPSRTDSSSWHPLMLAELRGPSWCASRRPVHAGRSAWPQVGNVRRPRENAAVPARVSPRRTTRAVRRQLSQSAYVRQLSRALSPLGKAAIERGRGSSMAEFLWQDEDRGRVVSSSARGPATLDRARPQISRPENDSRPSAQSLESLHASRGEMSIDCAARDRRALVVVCPRGWSRRKGGGVVTSSRRTVPLRFRSRPTKLSPHQPTTASTLRQS